MAVKASDCFRLGSISKTHGVGGRLVIRTEYNLALAEFDEPVFVVVDGLPVPLFFEEIIEKSFDSYIVKFEIIDTPEKAKEFVGCEILAPKRITGQGNIDFITQVIGIEVHDKKAGYLGICGEIEPIPGNPLMIVDSPKGHFFIPIADEYVVEFVPNKRIVLECPDGLLNL